MRRSDLVSAATGSAKASVDDKPGGLRREPPKVLRTGRRRRKPHRHPDARRPGRLVGMTMIDQRPAEAADRTAPRHWEGDLAAGAVNRSAIGTLVQRVSRFMILLHLPGGRRTPPRTSARRW